MIWILRSNQVAACNSHKWRTNQLQRLFHSRLPTCPKHLKKVLCTGSGGAGAGAGGAGGAAGAGAGAGWRWSRWWWRLRFRLWLRWWEVFAQIIDFLSIYCGQTATFHCPCVPAFVALSLYLYLSLSLLQVLCCQHSARSCCIKWPSTSKIHSFLSQIQPSTRFINSSKSHQGSCPTITTLTFSKGVARKALKTSSTGGKIRFTLRISSTCSMVFCTDGVLIEKDSTVQSASCRHLDRTNTIWYL